MKIRLYNSKNDIVQVLALENGVLIRYDGNREIWCPNADCYLDDDYNLVVVSGPNGISGLGLQDVCTGMQGCVGTAF